MRLQVLFDFPQFIAVQMNQPPAFFALAVKMRGAFRAFIANIFIAGAVARFQQILAHRAV